MIFVNNEVYQSQSEKIFHEKYLKKRKLKRDKKRQRRWKRMK